VSRLQAELTIDEGLSAFFAGDEQICGNPYPLFRRLREESPVHFVTPELVTIATHADGKRVFRDGETFRQFKGATGFADDFVLLNEEEIALFDTVTDRRGHSVVSQDGEEHRRIRDAFHRSFTPRRTAALGEVAQELTDEAIVPLAEQEVCDLIDLAYRVPLYVILAMLGIDREDADTIRRWGHEVLYTTGRTRFEPEGVRRQHDAWMGFHAYLGSMLEERRRDPGRTDLLAAMIEAEEADRLTNDELVASLISIINGGHETTTNLIANAVLALLDHRDQWELLCSDPDKHAPGAVEEALRYDAASMSMQRLAACDVSVGGVPLRAGTRVVVLHGSANRDPKAFDDPDVLDITRRGASDHLTFAYGPHFCLGAPLARLEAQVVLRTLARRFPELELAVPRDEVRWRPSPVLHGPLSLPIRLGPEHVSGA
jgi:cytochrome P450